MLFPSNPVGTSVLFVLIIFTSIASYARFKHSQQLVHQSGDGNLKLPATSVQEAQACQHYKIHSIMFFTFDASCQLATREGNLRNVLECTIGTISSIILRDFRSVFNHLNHFLRWNREMQDFLILTHIRNPTHHPLPSKKV